MRDTTGAKIARNALNVDIRGIITMSGLVVSASNAEKHVMKDMPCKVVNVWCAAKKCICGTD